MMKVGTLYLQLHIPGARSLKEKRRILKSLKDRLANKYSISIAEVDSHDKWQCAGVGIAMVGTKESFISSNLSKVVDYVRCFPEVCLGQYEIEVF